MLDITFGEGFAGIGGFRLGLEKASPRYKCIWANEFDPRPANIYWERFNYGDELDRRDFTKIDKRTIPNIDLFCGGFPCQPFSIAGNRRGFEDTRGTLFFDICELIQYKRPKCIFLENVRGLINHNQGETFYTIIRCLDELGYDCQWQVLDSQYFGVPQHRERTIIVAYPRRKSFPKILPIFKICKSDIALPTLTTRYFGAQANGTYISDENGTRRLTPIECERLQGFPDNWTKTQHNTDEDRYHVLGNAVTVNVIREIAIRIEKELFSDRTE